MKLLLLLLATTCCCLLLESCAGPAKGQTAPTSAQGHTLAPPVKTYVNILDYGAVGDDKHDDSPAILAAVEAAMKGNIRTIEFPPTTVGYLIGTPLVLPNTNGWMKLNLDSPLYLGATLTVTSFYLIYGNNPLTNVAPQFSPDLEVPIFAEPGVNPAINVSGCSIKLENLAVGFNAGGDGDGIFVGNSCYVTLENVSVGGQGGRNGVDVHITGDGFGFLIEKGVYSGGSTTPTFVFEGSPLCNEVGAVTMRDLALAGHGIQINVTCGIANHYSFENILTEALQDSFLTINAAANTPVLAIYFKDILLADPDPPLPLVMNHGQATAGMEIYNSWQPGTPEVAGNPISDLEIWSAIDVPVGQSTGYVFHGPSGIVSTMPVGTASSNRVRASSDSPLSIKEFLKRMHQ